MPNVNGTGTNVVIGGMIGKGGTPVGGVDTTLQIWGLYHMVGVNVSVCLGALDLGDFPVAADGSVTVSMVVTVSQVNAWSAAQLVAMDGGDSGYGESTILIQVNPGTGAVFVYVPCVIGQQYVTQGQRLRLATLQDAKTATGPALGMTRRTHMWSALLQNTIQVSFGSLFTPTPLGNMTAWDKIDPVTGNALVNGAAFSGVVFGTLKDGYSFDSQLCWQIDRPYPATISAISSFVQTQERK